MVTCCKCGEKIKNEDAIEWDWVNGQRYICPDCKEVEEDFYEEPEEDKNEPIIVKPNPVNKPRKTSKLKQFSIPVSKTIMQEYIYEIKAYSKKEATELVKHLLKNKPNSCSYNLIIGNCSVKFKVNNEDL